LKRLGIGHEGKGASICRILSIHIPPLIVESQIHLNPHSQNPFPKIHSQNSSVNQKIDFFLKMPNKQSLNCPTSFGVTMTNIASRVANSLFVLFSASSLVQLGEAAGGNGNGLDTAAGNCHSQGQFLFCMHIKPNLNWPNFFFCQKYEKYFFVSSKTTSSYTLSRQSI
jgi:hypothetical protein